MSLENHNFFAQTSRDFAFQSAVLLLADAVSDALGVVGYETSEHIVDNYANDVFSFNALDPDDLSCPMVFTHHPSGLVADWYSGSSDEPFVMFNRPAKPGEAMKILTECLTALASDPQFA